MPDNWGFVFAAYALAAVALLAYWRRLARKETSLAAPGLGHPPSTPGSRTRPR